MDRSSTDDRFVPFTGCRRSGLTRFGPASFTEAGTSFSNVLKFSTNIRASFVACSSYCAASGHVLRGFSTLSGTPGHVVGMSRLNTGCFSNATPASWPVSAAVIIARVWAIFMRLPTP